MRALHPSLRIHLDWIQYRTNFRDPVIVRRTTDAQGKPMALAEIAIDLRQADPPSSPLQLGARCRSVGPTSAADDGRVYLDDFRPYRECMIWDFNRLFWQHLGEWEAASGRGFEAALPSGQSDANHPDAVADSVTEFWLLLKELEEGPAAGGNCRARDRRRLRHARRGVDRRLQGARRAEGHRLLRRAAVHPRRLLARPRSTARVTALGAPCRPRQRGAAQRAQPVQGAVGVPVQGDVRPPDQRVRQPALRRSGAPRRPLYIVEVRGT